MSAALQSGALLVTLLGLVSGALALLRGRELLPATGVLLEFLLAAGLLRLADDPGWRQLVTAAAVVVLRRVVSLGLRQGG